MNPLGDAYVPIARWGPDHWSTLAYLETVAVDCAGFQVGADAKMRSNRRNFRVMHEECARPKRYGRWLPGIVMADHHGTRLNDGTTLPHHDDWCCVQDMAAEGLFDQSVEAVQPGVVLRLSVKGDRVVTALRAHKRAGGSFAAFRYEEEVHA